MKNKILITIVEMALILSILACSVSINTDDWGGNGETVRGSGTVVEESRIVSNFSGVELAMAGTLYITEGASESLRIEAENNLLEYIETNVRMGRLVIETRSGIDLQTTRSIKYYLTVVDLKAIVISSSGDVEAGDLTSDSFSITINSSGKLSISSLDCTSLHVEISSSGDVSLSNLTADSISVKISSSGSLEIEGGQVQTQTVNISSSGEYRARDLESVEADVTLTSSGMATIRVSDRLGGRLSSSGDIYYIGEPVVNVSTTSSGRVVKINE